MKPFQAWYVWVYKGIKSNNNWNLAHDVFIRWADSLLNIFEAYMRIIEKGETTFAWKMNTER